MIARIVKGTLASLFDLNRHSEIQFTSASIEYNMKSSR
jgi:hypothetical protein